MASLEDLPADQRAVLQMVLQRGRTYDEIANLLSIDRSAVRQRALDACDALTPEGIKPGPEQALVTDYLLSQLPEQVAEQVYIYLEAADDDREWAAAISDHLPQPAAKPIPEVPVAAPLRSDQAAVVEEPYLRPYEEQAPEQTASGPPPAQPPTPRQPPGVKPAAPPRADHSRSRPGTSSRQRRAMLVGALGVLTVVIAVSLVVLLGNNGSSPPKPKRAATSTHSTGTTTAQPNTTTSSTTTTNTGPQILAALNLTSPVGATQTLGVAQVVRDDGVVGIVIDAQGVPANSAHNAYGVWLTNSATSHKFVGFDPNFVGKNEKLAIEGTLPADASDFKHLLITLETQQHPKTPGEVVLSGAFDEK